jgi:hypothetical protein
MILFYLSVVGFMRCIIHSFVKPWKGMKRRDEELFNGRRWRRWWCLGTVSRAPQERLLIGHQAVIYNRLLEEARIKVKSVLHELLRSWTKLLHMFRRRA